MKSPPARTKSPPKRSKAPSADETMNHILENLHNLEAQRIRENSRGSEGQISRKGDVDLIHIRAGFLVASLDECPMMMSLLVFHDWCSTS